MLHDSPSLRRENRQQRSPETLFLKTKDPKNGLLPFLARRRHVLRDLSGKGRQ